MLSRQGGGRDDGNPYVQGEPLLPPLRAPYEGRDVDRTKVDRFDSLSLTTAAMLGR